MVQTQIPLKALYDPFSVPSGIAEFSTGSLDVVPIQFGGTGGHTLAEAQANLGIGGSSTNSLSSLTDVVITSSITDGQGLVWSAAGSKWVPEGVALLTGATFTGPLTASAAQTRLANIRIIGGAGLRDATFNPVLILTDLGSVGPTNFFSIEAASAGVAPRLGAVGADSDINFNVNTKGAGIFTVNDNPLQHSTLGGLTSPANDHTQYATLSGATFTGPLTASAAQTRLSNIRFIDGVGLRDASFNPILIQNDLGNVGTVNFFNIEAASAGNAPVLGVAGGDSNINFNVNTKGTGIFTVNGNGLSHSSLSNLTSPANDHTQYATLSGATFTGGVTVQGVLLASSVAPRFTNIKFIDGTGLRDISNNPVLILTDLGSLSGVNFFNIRPASGGATPYIAASGTDTNVDFNLVTKGTGILRANGLPVELQSNRDVSSGYISFSSYQNTSATFSALSSLKDTLITSSTSINQVLVWNGSKWTPSTVAGVVDDDSAYAPLSGAVFTGAVSVAGIFSSTALALRVTNTRFQDGTGIRDSNNNPVLLTSSQSVLTSPNYFVFIPAASGNTPAIVVNATSDSNADANIIPKGGGVLRVNGSAVEVQTNKDIVGGYISYNNYQNTSGTFSTLSSLTDTSITSATVSGQLLVFSGGKWTPSTLSFPIDNDPYLLSSIYLNTSATFSALSSLKDTLITSSVNTNQILTWSSTKWVPSTLTITFPTVGTSALSGLSDTLITSSVASGQLLVFSGGKWTPSTLSFPTDNDPYLLSSTYLNTSGTFSSLSSLGDTLITSSTSNNQVLTWSSTKWVPSSLTIITAHSQLTGLTSPANDHTQYATLSGATFTGGVNVAGTFSSTALALRVTNTRFQDGTGIRDPNNNPILIVSSQSAIISPNYFIMTPVGSGNSPILTLNATNDANADMTLAAFGSAGIIKTPNIFSAAGNIYTGSALYVVSDAVVSGNLTASTNLYVSGTTNLIGNIFTTGNVRFNVANNGLLDINGNNCIQIANAGAGLSNATTLIAKAAGNGQDFSLSATATGNNNPGVNIGTKGTGKLKVNSVEVVTVNATSNAVTLNNLTVSSNLNVSGNINNISIGMGTSAQAPAAPPSGSMWYSTDHNEMFIYYGATIGWAGHDQTVQYTSNGTASGAYWRLGSVIGNASAGFLIPYNCTITGWNIFQASSAAVTTSADLTDLSNSANVIDTLGITSALPFSSKYTLSYDISKNHWLGIKTTNNATTTNSVNIANIIFKRIMT